MSKIGKLPVQVPSNVAVTVTADEVKIVGPKGELKVTIPAEIKVEQSNGVLTVTRANDEKPVRALHGLVRSLLNNAVQGVTNGFTKTLEINGVGYRAEMKGADTIVLHIGFSHPVVIPVIAGVTIKIDKNQVIISGIDKQKVGEMAATIRAHRKPEPYKGKGIKYSDEIIKRKAGKTAATGVGAKTV